MEGQWIRLNRLFSGTRRAVIVSVDHGEFFGPIAGVIDLPEAIQSLQEADALLLSPGMLAHCGSLFAQRDRPQAIVRLNWSSIYCGQWGYSQARTAPVVSPGEALALGADLALASLTLSGTDEQADRDNVALFARLVSEKRQAGLPLIGEFLPHDAANLAPEQLHRLVLTACRILAELGADAVKTVYTGDDFAEVAEACPVPIFVVGAGKCESDSAALSLAYRASRAGARGVAFGLDVIQADSPARFLRGLRAVVKEDADPEAVAREYNLK